MYTPDVTRQPGLIVVGSNSAWIRKNVQQHNMVVWPLWFELSASVYIGCINLNFTKAMETLPAVYVAVY